MEEKKDQNLHTAFERILKKIALNQEKMPKDQSEWQSFIRQINDVVASYDEERHMMKQLVEKTNEDFAELNEQFETAESIARIGHWFFYPTKDKIIMSNETFRMFGIDPKTEIPSFERFMKYIYEEDRKTLFKLIVDALSEGKSYEFEHRIQNATDGRIYWVYSKVEVSLNENPTSDLDKYILSGIFMDIDERKKSEEKLVTVNQQLIGLSRQAGMSDVATSVLHNIGNILNSVNMSMSLIEETIYKSEVKKLSKVSKLIKDNIKNTNYLKSDKQGKLIPKFLDDLSQVLEDEYKLIHEEIEHTIKNMEHIKEIVVMQNDLSSISNIEEQIKPGELCDLAIKMAYGVKNRHNIKIIKLYDFKQIIYIDKSKFLQIMVNLIGNAKDALTSCKDLSEKKIKISFHKKTGENVLVIKVEDNGEGIATGDLSRVFSMGFTTKVGGHGFGLHSSAISAGELGGSLIAKSAGKGQGATFILTLPFKLKKEDVTNQEKARGYHGT